MASVSIVILLFAVSLLHVSEIILADRSCRQRLSAGSGTISSPQYPLMYNRFSDCEWIIVAEQSHHVTLTFDAFSLEDSRRCRFDYVEIRDGGHEGSNRIGRYCGTDIPPVITSSGHLLYVRFVSDHADQRTGFSANYVSGCSSTLRGRSGSFHSPNYPSNYVADLNCTFSIVAPENHNVQINFPVFRMEGADTHEQCNYDYIEVWEKSGQQWSYINRFCGNVNPSTVTASSNNVRVRFISDRSVSGQGFVAEYHSEARLRNACENDNGGCQQKCSFLNGEAHCTCWEGYALQRDYTSCQDVDECRVGEDKVCDQICLNTDGSYQCSCLSGYRLSSNGKNCDDKNECLLDRGGCSDVCINTVGSYRCECFNSEYQIAPDMRTCVLPLREPCYENNGGCQHQCHPMENGDHYCTCPPGYQLSDDRHACEDINECERPSSSHAFYSHQCNQLCVNSEGSYYCDCNEGFELSANGRVCKDIDECASGLRQECSQECENFAGGFECSCRHGYRVDPEDADECVDINECDNAPETCHTCVNEPGSFHCECNRGYEPFEDQTGCVDINECSQGNGGCSHVCGNLLGSHECLCRNGYRGKTSDNKICIDINECSSNGGRGPCSDSCTNTDGSYECSCQEGFYLSDDRETCEDIDECSVNNGACDQDCINTPGSHHCRCYNGYKRADPNVDFCIDVDECSEGLHECQSGDDAICVNLPGNYTCICPDGFELYQDFYCRDTNECLNETLNNCQQACINLEGSYNCSCHRGYQQISETSCADIDECLDNPCDHADQCNNTDGSFTCGCHDGFFLMPDGIECSDVNECINNNGGCDHQCINDKGGHRCECDVGYHLDEDNKGCLDLDECTAGARMSCCNQEHNCINQPGTYTCTCDAGYYMEADNCTCRDINECAMNNGGCEHDCNNTAGSYHCLCEAGFALDQLDFKQCHDINECLQDNGGCGHLCKNTNGSYECSCESNYTRLADDHHTCKPCFSCADFDMLDATLESMEQAIGELQITVFNLKKENALLNNKVDSLESFQTSILPQINAIAVNINRRRRGDILPEEDLIVGVH
ncbi:uncharacterized protein LOC144440635 [Glandiceps talaboti]